MSATRQGDLFAADQPDPSDENFETPTFYPDLDEVRAELHKILAEAKAASSMPWNDERARLYRTIFPQMTNCLPEDEGAQLRFAFDTEMTRLDQAA